jgi:hypothetical protein
MPDKLILVISDNEALMDSVIRVAQAHTPAGVQCLPLAYSRCTIQLESQIPGVDLFILDLLRHYSGGLRAEGVTLAHRLWKLGKRPLIISPLHCANANLFPSYWDTASVDTLGKRIELCFRSEVNQQSSLRELRSVFKPLMELPPQH